MAAALDREAVWSAGEEQWYAVEPTERVYRHTFVGVDSSGLLRPLADVAGREYVGVAGQAVFLGGSARCPVLQRGEGRFRFAGSAAQADVGLIAYAVDDETVTTDRDATVQGYAVGRIAAREPDGLVRVNITGFASTNLALFIGAWRRKFTVGPREITLEVATNYRLGVALPSSFAERTYCGELGCVDADVGAKVVINRDTSRKTASYCEWNVYVPPDTPGAAYGSLTFSVVAYLAGEGWTGGAGPFPGVWDGPEEIL